MRLRCLLPGLLGLLLLTPWCVAETIVADTVVAETVVADPVMT